MLNKPHRLTITLGLLLLAAGIAAQEDGKPSRRSAEIRINLPAHDSQISVIPEGGRVLIELPAGAVFPVDFAASSGGLLRRGRVVPLEQGRQRLELDLAMGLLERIDYEPEALVLSFSSRFDLRRQNESTTDQYILGPEDKIKITVHNHPELEANVSIPSEGLITAPLVGDVQAAGLTTRQLAGRLTELLGRSYLVDPQVEVDVADYRSQWVSVTGEVRAPGRFPLRGGTRLKQVLSETQGFTESAGEKITISRQVADGDDFATIEVDRSAFENGESDPVLRSGDLINVSRAAYCYLQGEVRIPNRVRVERGLTLLKAISLVGGLTDWADQKEIKVLDGGGGRPRVYNLRKIRKGKADDPILKGGEVIVVERRFL